MITRTNKKVRRMRRIYPYKLTRESTSGSGNCFQTRSNQYYTTIREGLRVLPSTTYSSPMYTRTMHFQVMGTTPTMIRRPSAANINTTKDMWLYIAVQSQSGVIHKVGAVYSQQENVILNEFSWVNINYRPNCGGLDAAMLRFQGDVYDGIVFKEYWVIKDGSTDSDEEDVNDDYCIEE
eukprot:197655_1